MSQYINMTEEEQIRYVKKYPGHILNIENPSEMFFAKNVSFDCCNTYIIPKLKNPDAKAILEHRIKCCDVLT